MEWRNAGRGAAASPRPAARDSRGQQRIRVQPGQHQRSPTSQRHQGQEVATGQLRQPQLDGDPAGRVREVRARPRPRPWSPTRRWTGRGRGAWRGEVGGRVAGLEASRRWPTRSGRTLRTASGQPVAGPDDHAAAHRSAAIPRPVDSPARRPRRSVTRTRGNAAMAAPTTLHVEASPAAASDPVRPAASRPPTATAAPTPRPPSTWAPQSTATVRRWTVVGGRADGRRGRWSRPGSSVGHRSALARGEAERDDHRPPDVLRGLSGRQGLVDRAAAQPRDHRVVRPRLGIPLAQMVAHPSPELRQPHDRRRYRHLATG